jgi:hypothetical protein
LYTSYRHHLICMYLTTISVGCTGNAPPRHLCLVHWRLQFVGHKFP